MTSAFSVDISITGVHISKDYKQRITFSFCDKIKAMVPNSLHKEEYGQEDTDLQLKKPPLYSVFLLNDDYTTMDFVVHVLETVFHQPVIEATRIMLHVHKNGKGLAGTYTREIAETKLETVHTIAREHEFPLKCSMEKE